jgi:hypothetical protein
MVMTTAIIVRVIMVVKANAEPHICHRQPGLVRRRCGRRRVHPTVRRRKGHWIVMMAVHMRIMRGVVFAFCLGLSIVMVVGAMKT